MAEGAGIGLDLAGMAVGYRQNDTIPCISSFPFRLMSNVLAMPG